MTLARESQDAKMFIDCIGDMVTLYISYVCVSKIRSDRDSDREEMIDGIIDYLLGSTFGPWLVRAALSAIAFALVVLGGWWLALRSRGIATTIFLALVWLVIVIIWGAFLLPILVQ